jgi:transcription elongation factor Elf1
VTELLVGARKLKWRKRRLERPATCSFCGADLAAYCAAYVVDRFPKVAGLHRGFACLRCDRKRGWRDFEGAKGIEHLELNPADFARAW